ncbi:MAG: glycosyltransferase [Thiotrichales bacterium]
MKDKTVVHILESMGAGTLTSVSQICNYLVDQGVHVHLIYSPLREETPDNWQDFFKPEVATHQVNMKRQFSPHKDLFAMVNIMRLLKKIKPDVVHAHSSKAGAITRAATFLSLTSPLVFYSPRGFGFLQLNYSRQLRFVYFVIEKFLAGISGQIIACSQSELAEARRLSPKCLLIENAVDESKLVLKNEEPVEDHVKKIGTLGRVGRQKNPELFAEIALKVRELHGDQVRFLWIGGGERRGIDTLEQAGCHVTGWVDRAYALEQLSDIDIYLQTSSWEGMPLSVIESQMMGIPGVVTNVIGNRDVIHDKTTGFVCDDTQSIVQRLGELIGNRETRTVMGDAAKKIGEKRFSVSRMGAEYMAVYGFDRPTPVAVDHDALTQFAQDG